MSKQNKGRLETVLTCKRKRAHLHEPLQSPQHFFCLPLHKEASLSWALPPVTFYSEQGRMLQRKDPRCKTRHSLYSREINDLLARGVLATRVTYYFFAWLSWCVLHRVLQRLHRSFKGRKFNHLLPKKKIKISLIQDLTRKQTRNKANGTNPSPTMQLL